RAKRNACRRGSPRRRSLLSRSHMTTTADQLPKPQAAPAADAEKPAEKRGTRAYFILGAVVLLAVIAYFVYRAVTAGHESTDDAQVATDMVPIAARVSGNLVEVVVKDNQAVKKGELIARIDPTDYDLREKQAEAELKAAEAQADAADKQVEIVGSSSKG